VGLGGGGGRYPIIRDLTFIFKNLLNLINVISFIFKNLLNLINVISFIFKNLLNLINVISSYLKFQRTEEEILELIEERNHR
jgi:hypothetical protein